MNEFLTGILPMGRSFDLMQYYFDEPLIMLVTVIAMAVFPIVYSAVIGIGGYRKPFHSLPEFLMLAASETAICRIGFGMYEREFQMYEQLFVLLMLVLMLYGMSIFCMIDYWERIVPNRILLLWLMLWIICMGAYGMYDMNAMLNHMFGVVLGLIFCMLSFGFCYLISKGSMGAGDVKLSIIMGIYMTGEYVVGAVLYGCILSAIFSLFMLATKKMTRKTHIPFVPFLYLGVIVRYLMG